MTFPFIKEAVENHMLTLHGLWTEIGEGTLECLDSNTREFSTL
jgi:carbonic anhydrase